MKRSIDMLVFLPALVFWVSFAISFRIANKLRGNITTARWRWIGVEAIDVDTYYWSNK